MKFDVKPSLLPHTALRLVRANCDIGTFAKAVEPVKYQYDVVSTLAKMVAEEGYPLSFVEAIVEKLVSNKEYIIQPNQTPHLI